MGGIVTVTEETWAVRAACASPSSDDRDAMFVQGAAQRDARVLCFACPVRLDCLLEALEEGMTHGVWGGLTERERRAMRRDASVRDDGVDGPVERPVDWRERLATDDALRQRFALEQQRGTTAGTRARPHRPA